MLHKEAYLLVLFAPAGHEQQVYRYIYMECLPLLGMPWGIASVRNNMDLSMRCALVSSATKCERQFGVQVESMDNLPSLSPIRSHTCLCACPRTHKCIHTGLVGGDPMICVLGGFWFPDPGPVYIHVYI